MRIRWYWWMFAGLAALTLLFLGWKLAGLYGVGAVAGGAGAMAKLPKTRRLWWSLMRSERKAALADERDVTRIAMAQKNMAATEREREELEDIENHARKKAIALEKRIDALNALIKVALVCVLASIPALSQAETCEALAQPDPCPAPLKRAGEHGCWIPLEQWDKRTERTQLLQCAIKERKTQAYHAGMARDRAVLTTSISKSIAELHAARADRCHRRLTQSETIVMKLLHELQKAQNESRQCLPPWLQVLTYTAAVGAGAGLGIIIGGNGGQGLTLVNPG